MTGKTDPVAAAHATLTDLTDERERVDARLADIGAEREKIAHAALTGDAAARAQLEALKKEAGELADHRKDVEAAVAYAERDVAKAIRAADRRQEVAAANRRKAFAARLRTIGQEADEGKLGALATIPEDSIAAGIDYLGIERIGPLLMLALHTAFQPLHRFMDVKERRMVRPADRCTFGELLGRWADRIDQEADLAIAGRSEPKKEAA